MILCSQWSHRNSKSFLKLFSIAKPSIFPSIWVLHQIFRSLCHNWSSVWNGSWRTGRAGPGCLLAGSLLSITLPLRRSTMAWLAMGRRGRQGGREGAGSTWMTECAFEAGGGLAISGGKAEWEMNSFNKAERNWEFSLADICESKDHLVGSKVLFIIRCQGHNM